jgi:hypothetical protein
MSEVIKIFLYALCDLEKKYQQHPQFIHVLIIQMPILLTQHTFRQVHLSCNIELKWQVLKNPRENDKYL